MMRSWTIDGFRLKRPLKMPALKKWILPRPTITTLSDICLIISLDKRRCDWFKIRVFPEGSEFYRPAEMGYSSSDNKQVYDRPT